MRSRRIAYAVLLLILIIAEIYINNLYSLLLLAVGIFLPAVSILFCLISKSGLKYELDVLGLCKKGDELAVKVKLFNSHFTSVAMVRANVSIVNTLTGSKIEKEVRTTVSGKSEHALLLALEEYEIGKLYIAVSNVRITDLFNLISFRAGEGLQATTLVVPNTAPLIVNFGDVTESTGDSLKYSENLAGNDPSETFGIREYVPGDEIKKIHWKLSSKADGYIVKEYGRPLNYSVVVLIELAKTDPENLESCAEFASSLSEGLLNAGIMHTLVWHDSATDEMCYLNIGNYEEKESAVLKLVSACYHQESTEALDRYLSGENYSAVELLMYVTTLVDVEKLLQNSLRQETKVYYATTEPAIKIDGLNINKISKNIGVIR